MPAEELKMQKEVIEQIRSAEEKAEALETEAAAGAQKIISDAGKEAAGLLKTEKEKALKEREETLAAEKSRMEQELNCTREEAAKTAESMRETAEGRMPEAVKAVLRAMGG